MIDSIYILSTVRTYHYHRQASNNINCGIIEATVEHYYFRIIEIIILERTNEREAVAASRKFCKRLDDENYLPAIRTIATRRAACLA